MVSIQSAIPKRGLKALNIIVVWIAYRQAAVGESLLAKGFHPPPPLFIIRRLFSSGMFYDANKK
ncbi:MAG: hypothetical protein LBU34_14100 [Planctomycetaceae bacterium]|jgi:hypothetical protein|nr:hypothetical protein [Planctomycetaceae bacterium]